MLKVALANAAVVRVHVRVAEGVVMGYRNTLFACCLAGVIQAASADTTEYLLIPLEQDMPEHGEAVVVEPPHAVNFDTGDCGRTFTVVGDGSDSTDEPAEHYGGTAYSGQLKVENSSEVAGFVMTHAMKVGTHLSNFQVLDSGQVCSERVNGKRYSFRKFSADLR